MENVQSKDFSVVLLLVALALKVPQSRRHELQAKHKAGMPMHKRARVFASRAFLRSKFSCNGHTKARLGNEQSRNER